MLQTKTPANGTLGWTVVGESGSPDRSSQLGGMSQARRRWKWSAFSPEGGAWGYESTKERATERAREEFARLTGGDA